MADYTIVVGAFRDVDGADSSLSLVKDNAKSMGTKIGGAGIVRREADGTVSIKDTGDWGFMKGAVAGGVATAVVGVLMGPIGWAGLAAGALGGGVIAKVKDSNVEDDKLRALGASAKNAGSAIVVMVDPSAADQMDEMLKGAGADATAIGLDDTTVERLAEAAKSIA